MVTRHRLENGLTVLLDEDHSAPVTAVLTHVKTGYFHEEDRYTGISHLLEHMYFKGTPRRPGPEDIAQATKSIGGLLNAFTYYEETGYYCVCPSDRLADALEIQSDALTNAAIDADQLRSETEVVLQEAEQKKDSAWAYATENLFALAFDRHRIRRWRIGDPETLRALTRDDMVRYYRGTYHPENMVLVVAGDFDPETALVEIDRRYNVAGGERYVSPGPSDGLQTAPRRRRMSGDIRQRLVLLGFHTPALLQPDSFALDILSGILSDGRSSRLYRNVRERGIATSLQAYNQTFRELGYFVLAGESMSDDVEATASALWREVQRIKDAAPDAEEMGRVKTRIRSRWVFDGEECLGRARRLAAFESIGGYEKADAYLNRLMAVSAGDVQRAAQTYFQPENASLLEYLPRTVDAPETPLEELFATPSVESEPAPPVSVAAIDLVTPLPPGMMLPAERRPAPGGTLAMRRSGSVPVVAMEILWPGGRRDETRENAGITNLMLRSSLKGTASRSAEEIASAFESLGSSLDWIHGLDFWGFSFHVVAERFPHALALAADVARNPAFPGEEVAREKETLFADIRRSMDNGMDRAVDLLDEISYGAHPYSFPDRGIVAALEAVTPDELHAWHGARRLRPFVAAVGGAFGSDEIEALITEAFPERSSAAETEIEKPGPWPPEMQNAEQRDRKQTAAALGFRTVDAQSEDRFALDAIAQIVSGLGGRFFAEVRGRQGLAYVVSAWHSIRRDAGMFITYTATAPDKENQARAALLNEFARLRDEPVTAGELERAKAYIAGVKTISLQTSAAHARELSRNLMYGRPLDSAAQYVTRIQALTADDLQRAAQKYFREDSWALGVVRGSTL